MKVADIKLGWKKSVSADVDHVKVIVMNDGIRAEFDLGPEVESVQITVQATKSFQFTVITFDSEGLEATSTTYSHTLGDLEAPQPATDLFHEVLAIRDVADEPVS